MTEDRVEDVGAVVPVIPVSLPPARRRRSARHAEPATCLVTVAPDDGAQGDGSHGDSAHSGSARAAVHDLREVPLFASLSDDNLAQLAQTVLKQRAPAGQTLCREGERGDEMYVILSGAVTLRKTVDSHETDLARLESGAHFGEMALIGDAPRTATIIAATNIEYLAVDRETLLRVIAAFPSVALQILKGYNGRLAETTQRLAGLTVRLASGVDDEAAGDRQLHPVTPDELYRQAVDQTIANGPYPLAALVRKMQVEEDWDRKVLQALDVFEVVVKYTVLLLVADYLARPAGRTPELDGVIAAAVRRPTLGQLLELSARVLRAFAGREGELFMPELYGLYFRPDGSRAPSARVLLALTTYRNRLKHGAEGVRDEDVFRLDFEGRVAPGAESDERRVGVKQQVASILRDVAFLARYPLVHLTSMTYEHGTFQYGYERCTGAYADFDHGVFAGSQPLENKRLYLLSERDQRVLRVDPLIRRLKCPECGRRSIFILFSFFPERERPVRIEDSCTGRGEGGVEGAPSWRRERLEYLSYACGHTYTDQLTPERVEAGEGLTRLLAPVF